MSYDPTALPAEVLAFLAERHLGTLTTLRPDGSPHVVAIAFTHEPPTAEHPGGVVRIITRGGSRKVAHVLAATGRAAVCQVDGGRWLTLEGTPVVRREAEVVADAVERYAARYRPPSASPTRVVVEIAVDRVLGRVPTP